MLGDTYQPNDINENALEDLHRQPVFHQKSRRPFPDTLTIRTSVLHARSATRKRKLLITPNAVKSPQ